MRTKSLFIRTLFMRFSLSVLFTCLFAFTALAQDGAISVSDGPEDALIAERLSGIYSQITDSADVNLSVNDGVVTLSGEAANDAAAQRAVNIARRVDGVVAVQDDITRTLAVTDNVGPLADAFRAWGEQTIRALPLILAALVSLVVIILFGRWLSRRNRLIKKFAKNPFLVELIATAVNIIFIVIGIVVALNILGATALIGTVLGGAGIIGVALGFGVRDTVENYVASLLLSLRQPFRAKDHVVIDGQEGIVVRLNTRATILMTLSGNHLRIPNAKVFKADILNYSTNPNRRFSFGLGVDSADDPVAAIRSGVETLKALPFTLDDPAPSATIKEVGDSSILIDYFAWIDQRDTGFGSARSQAIRDVKDVLENGGFSLPEPLYRLRVEGAMPVEGLRGENSGASASGDVRDAPPSDESRNTQAPLETDAEITITDRVEQERRALNADGNTHVDLLDETAERE